MTTQNPLALDVVDVIARGQFDGGLELRNDTDADTGGTTLVGHFSVFDSWYEIDSFFEGRFLERVAPGAYARTIKNNRNQMRVAFDHGYDPTIGDKPLGPIETLREDDIGAYYEVPLLDTDYNRDFVLPALQGRTIDGRQLGSVLGASFRFRVIGEEWNMEPEKGPGNPDGIPERTITEARVFEFGPVVYPANAEATAGVRCLTDHLFERSLARSDRTITDLPAALANRTAATEEPADPREHSTETPTRNQIRTGIDLIRAELGVI